MEFSMSVVKLINTLFIAGGIGICGLCFMQITASIHLLKVLRNYFQIFFIMIILYISAHLARELMDGIPGHGIRTALYIVTFVEILTAGLMTHMISMLVLSACKNSKPARPPVIFLFAVLGMHVLILAAGEACDLIYYFDETNTYHRASGYLLSNLAPFIMLVFDVVLLIRYNKNLERRIKIAFWVYMIAPIGAIVIQSLAYGVQFIIFATVGASVYMFCVIIQDQNAIYEKKQQESSRIETELSMASRIQADMLPNIYPAFPERPEFDIYAKMDPAKEVGGDFYDFFLIDDDHICLIMADVSGKGVPAALFMMASRIILANNAMMGKSPAMILTDANSTICGNNREEMFVTVWLGILELSTGKLTAANAGHEFPAIKKPGGQFKFYEDKHGLFIGCMEGVKYSEYELTLEPGSKLFLYTDGVPEATDADKEMFGMERLAEALNEERDPTPEKILINVRAAVDRFVKDAEQFDDLTMLCVEYTGQKNPAIPG